MSFLESLTVDYHKRKAASCPSTPNPSPAHELTSAPEKLSKPSSQEGTSGERMYFVLTNRDLQYSLNDDVCWETHLTKETNSLVAHQNVDELRDLALEIKTQQESPKSCSKSSTSTKSDVPQETFLTMKATALSADQSINHERMCVHDECRDLVAEPEVDDVVDIIYDGKRSRPPDVVDNDHTKSNIDSCTSLSAPPMLPEAWVADKVKAPQEPQDGERVLISREGHALAVIRKDDDVIDIIVEGKPKPPPNLEP